MNVMRQVRLRLGHVDRDIARISDYLADDLSPLERAKVETRLRNDGEFFNKAWPLMEARMAVWNAGPMELARLELGRDEMDELDDPDEVTDDDIADVYARVRQNLGLPPRPHEELRADMQAASFAPEFDSDDTDANDGMVEIEERGSWRSAMAKAQWERGGRWMAAGLATAVAFVCVTTLWSMHAGRVANAREAAESLEQRTYTGFLPNPRRTELGPREGRLIELADGSQVLLGPGARLTDEDQALALDGHAEVMVNTSSYLVLHTPVGRALLLHGKYDVDAPIGGLPTLVQVDSGEAHVEGKDAPGRGIVARPGEKARVTPTQAEIVK